MISGINHVTIVVNNKPEAENFYCNVLGFRKLQVGKSLWVKIGDQYIHINENPNLLRLDTFHHFAIEINNLIPYLKNLIKNNIEIFDLDNNMTKLDINTNLDKPGRTYFAHDPAGNLIEFIDSFNQFFKQ